MDEELITAYMENVRSSDLAHKVDEFARERADIAFPLICRIINLLEEKGDDPNDVYPELRRMLESHGQKLLPNILEESRTNRSFLKVLANLLSHEGKVPPNYRLPNDLTKELVKIVASGNSSSQAISPSLSATKDLPPEHKQIIESWITCNDTLWATQKLDDFVHKEPEKALSLTLEILKRSTIDTDVAYIAAGPLENLLHYHGDKVIAPLEEAADKNEIIRISISGVWLNERDDSIYPEWERLMKKYEYWDTENDCPIFL